jgi:hypothetical protein
VGTSVPGATAQPDSTSRIAASKRFMGSSTLPIRPRSARYDFDRSTQEK